VTILALSSSLLVVLALKKAVHSLISLVVVGGVSIDIVEFARNPESSDEAMNERVKCVCF